MSETIDRPPPRQARAEEKRAKILKAAEQLLAERAPSDVTTKAVASKAGVPIGSVYRYFANADALLFALFDEFNSETLRTMAALPSPSADWHGEVAQVFSVIKAMHARHPAYGPLMAHLGRADETDDNFLVLLAKRVGDFRTDLAPSQAQDIAAMVVGIVEAAERRFHALPVERRDNVFAEAQKATEAYLLCYLPEK
ncbi:MAG: helix-turn-helix domain-containing protein [Pseudomonadota bacterium]